MQEKQPVAPVTPMNEPTSHGEQDAEPALLEYEPTAQGVHALCPAVAAKLPAAHARHVSLLTAPLAAPYRPGPQRVQAYCAGAGLYDPAGQKPQMLLDVPPPRTTPCAYVPIGHGEHCDARLVLENVPSGQSLHLGSPREGAAVPGGQSLHTALDDPPTLLPNRPV